MNKLNINLDLIGIKTTEKSAYNQFLDALMGCGISSPDKIIFDGQMHRFSTNGKPDDTAGWYILFDGDIKSGCFGDWRIGDSNYWRENISRVLTSVELATLEKQIKIAAEIRYKEMAKKRAVAEKQVLKIWDESTPAQIDFPYLTRKQVGAFGIKIGKDGRIIIPVYSEIGGQPKSLQYINESGQKRFHPGAQMGGNFGIIAGNDDTIFICEGYSTGGSVYQATNNTVILSFSANNLPEVARKIREQFGDLQKIIIIADNDESGVGEKYAKQAADIIDSTYILPPVLGDVNDWAVSGNDLKSLLLPEVPDVFLHKVGDLLEQPAPIQYDIKHWLPKRSLIMVHGSSGVGKTFLVLDMMLSITSGRGAWFGENINKGGVVYLAGEGYYGLRRRAVAWTQYNKIDISNAELYLSSHGVDLNTPAGYLKVYNHVKALSEAPTLIVVDTLHRFLRGDENSAQDTKTMIDACNNLMKEFNCSVLLVHHTGVSTEAQHRGRGSSSWRGALDVEISITQKNKNLVCLSQEKNKDDKKADDLFFQLIEHKIDGWVDEDGEPVSSVVVVQQDAPREMNKDSIKFGEGLQMLNKAWLKSGAPLNAFGLPIVYREQFKEYLRVDLEFTDAQVQNAIRTTPGRVIGSLIQAGYIKLDNAEEIVIIDQGVGSGWILENK